jgi:hypothetical protein
MRRFRREAVKKRNRLKLLNLLFKYRNLLFI